MPSLNEIFSKERKEYLTSAEAQLGNSKFFSLPIYRGSIKINYAILELLTETYDVPVMPLTGWGSGWEGCAPLAFSMACEGFLVILPSLPGYGSSDSPPPEVYKGDYFGNTAYILSQFLKKLDVPKVHLIGHSMGGEVAAMFSERYPEMTGKLILLSPSGFEKRGFFSGLGLTYRFMSSGVSLHRSYSRMLKASGEEDYLQSMIDLCGKQESALQLERIGQRYAEFRAICRGGMTECLSWFDPNMPVLYASGAQDKVFPPNKTLPAFIKAAKKLKNRDALFLAGIGHNPTLFQSEIAAAAIAHYLEE